MPSTVTCKFKATYVLSVLAVILSFMSTPYITPYLLGPIYIVVSSLILLILMFAFIFYGGLAKSDNWNKLICLLVCIAITQGAILFLYYVSEEGINGLRYGIGSAAKYMMLLPICWLIKKHYNLFLNLLWYSNCIIILFAILLFFLFLFGIELPYIEFSPDGRPHYFFYIGATNVILSFGNYIIIRTAGYCDEPGQLALVLTYLIILNEFTFKKNLNRIFLVIAGFFTFSFAFFITLVPIIIYWIKIGLLRVKNLVKLSIFFIIIIEGINLFLISRDMKEDIDVAIETLIFNRFEIGEDGKMKGDNRSVEFSNHLEALKKYPILGAIGKGQDECEKYRLSSPTFIGAMAYNGIIFSMLYYLPYFFLFYKYKSDYKYWLFICIGLNFLQRPGLNNMFHLIICSLIYYSSKYYEYKRE